MTISTIMNVWNFWEFFFTNKLAKLFHKLLAINHVWNFFYDNLLASVFLFNNFKFCTQSNVPMTSRIGILNAFCAHYLTTSREIRARKNSHEFLSCNVLIVEHHHCCVNCFAKIVRRNVCCHADSNSIWTVHEQTWKSSRKNFRFLQCFVVVWHPLNGVFIKITKEFHCSFTKTRLCITHSSSTVTIDWTKVSMAINQWNSHWKWLC